MVTKLSIHRELAVIAIAVLVVGCTNGFEKFYRPVPGLENLANDTRFEPPPASPVLHYHSADLDADRLRLEEEGYVFVGAASFTAPINKVSQKQAIAQAKKVGAQLVMFRSRFSEKVTRQIPITLKNPDVVTTVRTSGSVSSSGSGSTNSNVAYNYNGNGDYSGTSTITTPGGFTTYRIPKVTERDAYIATFWVKLRVEKMRLGVNVTPLPENIRTQMQRNTGVLVSTVVQGTPAFKADILRGDVIVAVNGQVAIDPKEFRRLLEKTADSPLSLDVRRNGNQMSIQIPARSVNE